MTEGTPNHDDLTPAARRAGGLSLARLADRLRPDQVMGKLRVMAPTLTQTITDNPLSPAEIESAIPLPVQTHGVEERILKEIEEQALYHWHNGNWRVLGDTLINWDQKRRTLPSGKRYVATATLSLLKISSETVSHGVTPEDTVTRVTAEAMENFAQAYQENPDHYALAALYARALIENGWASHGTKLEKPLKGRKSTVMEQRVLEAAALLDHFNPVEFNSPFLAETRYKLLPALKDAQQHVIDWFEDWRDLDPFAIAPHALQGYYLLPRWFGSYEQLDAEATRAADPIHDGLAAGAYAAFFIQALDADPFAVDTLDVPLFLAGLDSIVDTHNRDQHLVNMLLAWFCCDFKGRPSRLTEGRFTRTRSNNTLRLATGRKDFARKYLRRVVPSHWSGGEVRAWSELGALFSEELLAGDVAHLGAKGLQFRDPVRL